MAVNAAGQPSVIYDSVYLAHDTGAHPERAQRLHYTMTALQANGLLDVLPVSKAAPVSREDLLAVHTPAYVESLERFCAGGGGMLAPDPTYASPMSYTAALAAAGAGVLAVDMLFSAPVRPSFALVRPPGHHALPDRAMGFCLFNNVAVAAKYTMRRYGLERVLIVDYDVHHGNGTQDIFYRDGRVLFISVHQHPLFPGTGFAHEVGAGPGEGATINIPLPPGSDDLDYEQVFDAVIAPAARRFQPELILVSAGFDAHWRDPLASMNLTVSGYATLARQLLGLAGELCDNRVAFLLEGGYDLEATAQSVEATLRVMLGETPRDGLGAGFEKAVGRRAAGPIAEARRLHGL